MIAYDFYRRDEEGKAHFIWVLPERRKDAERITKESILNWGRKTVVDDKEAEHIFFIQVEIDEAQIEYLGLNSHSELRKKFNK
jgi:hypothetical protein